MAEFTSSQQVSSFPDPNILFNSASGITGQKIRENELLNQGKQIDLSNANMAQVQQAAGGLLSAYPDEPSRAAAWAPTIGMLQSQGYAMHAPATYPGEAVLRSLVNQSIPAKDLYSSGALMTPAQQQLLNSTGTTPSATSTTGTAPPASGSVATAPSGTIEPAAFNNATAVRDGLIKRGIDADTATALAANALHESVANPRTGRGDNGNSAGLFQWAGPRLQSYTDAYGHSPDGSPLDEQLDNVVRELKGSEAAAAAKIAEAQGPAAKAAAVSQYYLRPKDTVPEMQRRSATALQLQQQIGGSSTASATPATAPAGGVAARTGGTDTAGPAAGSTPPTAAPAGPPAAQQPLPQDQAVAQAKATGQAVPVAGTQALWALPSGNITGTPPPAATPPAPATAPAQPPAAAPASTSRLPEASTIPTGQNSAPYRQAMQLQQQAMQYDAVAGTNPAFAKRAADLRLQAAGILQAGATVSAQQNGREGELEVVTGKFTPYAPLPSPRGMQGTAAAWDGSKWVPVTPENQANAVQGTWAVTGSGAQFYPNSPAAIQRQEEAKTSGAATGTETAKVLPALIAQARAAAKNEGDIDYASNQIAQAAKGNIPTGYFSGALATAAAVAKSLGIDTTKLGVDPAAVGNIQSAQKTLAVLGGAILRGALGPGSQITDSKIEAFEHTQPGIETDPQALQRIMAWARSQYTYEREMGTAAVQEAAKPENNGILPPILCPALLCHQGLRAGLRAHLGRDAAAGREPAGARDAAGSGRDARDAVAN